MEKEKDYKEEYEKLQVEFNKILNERNEYRSKIYEFDRKVNDLDRANCKLLGIVENLSRLACQ